MQPAVTGFIKQRVIEGWFRGLKRDEIAKEQGIGTGTVTRIIREWVADLEDGDGDIADGMRYLAVAFRKLKLTIPQCTLGARTGIMMKNLGIEENDFDAFISGTYKFLKELEVDPKKMAYYVKQMEDLAATMPIAKIPEYISELDAKRKQLLQKIEELESDELDRKVKVDMLKNEALDLGKEFQQFDNIKLELKSRGLEINHLGLFAEAVKEAHKLGYDGHLIGSRLAYWDELEKKELDLAESVHNLEHKKEVLEARISKLQADWKRYSTYGYPN